MNSTCKYTCSIKNFCPCPHVPVPLTLCVHVPVRLSLSAFAKHMHMQNSTTASDFPSSVLPSPLLNPLFSLFLPQFSPIPSFIPSPFSSPFSSYPPPTPPSPFMSLFLFILIVEFVQHPQDVKAILGDPARLHCSRDPPGLFIWLHYLLNGSVWSIASDEPHR